MKIEYMSSTKTYKRICHSAQRPSSIDRRFNRSSTTVRRPLLFLLTADGGVYISWLFSNNFRFKELSKKNVLNFFVIKNFQNFDFNYTPQRKFYQ